MRDIEYASLLYEINKVHPNFDDFYFTNDEKHTRIVLKADDRLFFELTRKPSSVEYFRFRYSRYDPIYSIRKNKGGRWQHVTEAIDAVRQWLKDQVMPRLQDSKL